MARSALIIGGTGQIGQAAAQTLLHQGWNVSLVHRGKQRISKSLIDQGAREIIHDRDLVPDLSPVIGKGADIVIDALAFDVAHADQLLQVQADVGAFFVISSSSVYCDGQGRTLDEARETGFPDLPHLMTEAQATVAPGPEC